MQFEFRQPTTLEDHEWLVELHNDPDVLHNITHPTKITLAEHLAWWQGLTQSKTQLRFIAYIDDIKIGFVKFYDIDQVNKSCALGADIHAIHRGKGYAYPLWEQMINYAFKHLCLHRVCLTVATYNKRARHIYEKLGFQIEGKLFESLLRDHVFYDQICMYLINKENTNV